MSAELSPYAIHRIIYLLENDDRRSRQAKKTHPGLSKQHLRKVNQKWDDVYKHYFLDRCPPPMDYLGSLELAVFLRKDLDNEVMRPVFGHGKPLVFERDRPRLLVPAIIEAFQQLQEEPSFLDVALDISESWGPDMALSAVWPQAYIDCVPCTSWTASDLPGRENKEMRQEVRHSRHTPGFFRVSVDVVKAARFVVEKFRIPSNYFNKQLVIELYFALDNRRQHAPWVWPAAAVRPPMAPNLEKDGLRYVATRLDGPPCTASTSGVARKSESPLLLPDFAFDVYGFLDRAHVGTSLLANSDLSELIFKLRNRLPVHHLTCEFEKHHLREGRIRHFLGEYQVVLRRFQSDLTYSDMRRFKVPSEFGPLVDCALIVRHLSNSHLFHFKRPEPSSRFVIKMLAALGDRNFSVGSTLRLWDEELSDYRSMHAAFGGGTRVTTLELSLFEHKFASLVKTTDFFRTSAVQRLKVLKLRLESPWIESEEPRRWEILPLSLLIDGIPLLRNADRFDVEYDSNRLLRPICLKLVQLCEKFERGEVTELVHQFKFATSRFVALPFKERNKTASGMKVAGYEWDVYRFRNAITGNWLTACVGRTAHSHRCVVLIAKGGVYLDDSFDAD